ncbi:SDR family NAD(P)-dependent oxidoreductase [Caenimonas aquaedulcis]|uniref:SDR family oxidoreductase n=1 Tax=Caenimonas aquaedulcis TaxID=2793270 RepID=A0A931MEB8_9BURK|nr:SDR family oxidoreductase [Caenimonas aquaedulcis]MBG9386672.1 SDR family oxidoreductase [Caenimonas aquaedulcis]
MNERQVAIVTGSGTGVGAATALMLAQRGWNLVINYTRSEQEARASQAACEAAGADTLLLRGDVAQDAECRAMVQAAHKRWKRIDALVNNAGISVFGPASTWEALDAETFQRILAVNSIGLFQMVRACAPHLKESKGAIVNVSSIAGALGIGSSVPYIASKGAVNAMTLHLARALAPEVRVNAVCPGLITSRWFVQGIGQEGFEKVKASVEQATPLGRASTPEDVAEAIVWLVAGARTMTGELLLLDGGTHLGARQPVQIPVK